MKEQELKEFLTKNNGKPEGMTWFQIAEMFDVHVTEGKYTEAETQKWKDARGDKTRQYWNRIKPKAFTDFPYENLKPRRTWEVQTKGGGTKLLHSFEFQEDPEDFTTKVVELLKQEATTLKPISLKVTGTGDGVLIVPIADIHIGAIGASFMKENIYNKKVVKQRLDRILYEILAYTKGKYESIVIADLGDSLDGYEGKTTRGGHDLQQNMTTREQFETYFECFKEFFDKLVNLELADRIQFIGMSNSNHSGPHDYTAHRGLEIYLNAKYPEIRTFVTGKFISYLTFDNHCYLFTHGKDEKYMKHGLPLTMDTKTEVYFQRYLDAKDIKSKWITIVKGDLHQGVDQQSYKMRYKSVPSFFGGTEYIHTLFGPNLPGVVIDHVRKNKREAITIPVYFED